MYRLLLPMQSLDAVPPVIGAFYHAVAEKWWQGATARSALFTLLTGIYTPTIVDISRSAITPSGTLTALTSILWTVNP
jgi:hypothetical protein